MFFFKGAIIECAPESMLWNLILHIMKALLRENVYFGWIIAIWFKTKTIFVIFFENFNLFECGESYVQSIILGFSWECGLKYIKYHNNNCKNYNYFFLMKIGIKKLQLFFFYLKSEAVITAWVITISLKVQ